MDWTAPIDAYCERLDAGFWAEPVNAVTNAAFLIAALFAFRDWRASGQGDPATFLLAVIVAVVGVGSFLFHTFATRWAALADVLPIALFINIYFCLALRRLVGLSWPLAVFGTLLFLGASYALGPLFGRLAGSSGGYVPALGAIFGVAATLWLMRRPGAGMLAVTGMAFLLSLVFRTADMPACEAFPPGTHFVWHCLNALVLFLLIRLLIRAKSHEGAPAAAPAGNARDTP
ncbi:MAG: hypothetical protein CMN87_06285 [Stappia sp.]|uniref:ceramidase domain-containing protein n=1 Tax=Stappia sp. TaxID=1870903 RepID=UPI000C3CB897|nr:ceramidase domain-containing protein [Stappia sp.]MBM19598.1 hypothetical protein [Stappia sp.]